MNKKLLALAATGLLCTTGVSAHDFEVDGIYYNITSEEDKTVEVTYQGDNYGDIEEYSGAVSIPATVTYDGQEYSVTSIGYEAFAWCYNLTSVQIPNSVTSIDSWAFDYCYNLTYVSIPNSVNSIGDFAFWYCSSLTYVPIPDSVNGIGDFAFQNCSGLTLVVIPNSVTSIGEGAFSGCSNLSSLVVATGNPVYDSREECNAIIESASNTLIAGSSSSTIPNGVTSIGDYAFYNVQGLTSVAIPNSVTNIGNHAFQDCDNLTSVDFPNSVTNIGDYAFGDCYGLASVTIPGSVTHIANNAFLDCSNLSSFVVAADNPVYDSREGCNALIESATNTLIAGSSSSTIPYGVTSIGDYAFCNVQGLTSVAIPNSVTNIGNGAFYNCSGLTTITSNIPADKLFSIYEYVFYGVDKTNCTLNVPYGAQAAYASKEGWSDFANIVEMEPTPFDLTVSSAGYATLYLDYTVQIPEGVEVYTANEVEGNLLKMEPVAGVLPANTGVVVKAPAGTYTFTYSDTYAPEISDNLFKGSATYEYVDVAFAQTAFVLSKVDGEVGMYPAKLTDGRFLNNANKAYLLLTTKLGVSDEELDTSVGGSQLSLRFDFGGTTGVDKVQTESGADAVIYDLYGRKVNKATTPGFYIINNKKVWVK